VAQVGPTSRLHRHWLSGWLPISEDTITDASTTLGMTIRGTGYGWPPSEVGKLPWSEIQTYCDRISEIWEALKKK
jgi:hypothetical protein